MSDLDLLTSNLAAGFNVSHEENSISTTHPRFSDYKNYDKARKTQEKRRSDFLERQKSARFDHVNHSRKLALQEFERMDTSEKKQTSRFRTNRKSNFYKDQLMLSEWLVDIPSTLDEAWIMIPCPEGHRCLVVASKGVTTVYKKSGYMTNQFSSYLPGGGSDSKGYTILDCIFNSLNRTFYALDLICWNGIAISENETDCRFYLLASHLTENANFVDVSPINPYRIVPLSYCNCDRDSMERMMATEFQFKLDGVLFYHKSTHYLSGVTPLVGWLKPFMLPQILNVSLPQSMLNNGEQTQDTRKFINNFNKTDDYFRHFGKNTVTKELNEEDEMMKKSVVQD